MYKFLSLLIISVFAANGVSQEIVSEAIPTPRPASAAVQEAPVDQNAPMVFKDVKYDKWCESVVKINLTRLSAPNAFGFSNKSQAHGTGVILSINLHDKHPTKELYKAIIATCEHVVRSDTHTVLETLIQYQNGAECTGHILNYDSQNDVALVSTYAPKEYMGIQPATEMGKYNQIAKVCGYPFATELKKPKYIETKIWRMNKTQIQCLEDNLPGFSGSPIFTEDGKLLGLISRGSLPFTNTGIEKYPYYTSPMIGPTYKQISGQLKRMVIKTSFPERAKNPDGVPDNNTPLPLNFSPLPLKGIIIK